MRRFLIRLYDDFHRAILPRKDALRPSRILSYSARRRRAPAVGQFGFEQACSSARWRAGGDLAAFDGAALHGEHDLGTQQAWSKLHWWTFCGLSSQSAISWM